MGKRKAEDSISVSYKAEVIEVPNWEIDANKVRECEVGLECDISPMPNAASVSLEELSQSEGLGIGNQPNGPTGLTVDEGVAATDGVTGGEEEARESDLEPITFWQLLELAGYEVW